MKDRQHTKWTTKAMTINSYLNKLDKFICLNGDERERITKSIAAIKLRLDAHFNRKVCNRQINFKFGSYDRGTILSHKVDERSDIDYMVVFDDNQYTPKTYLDWLRKFVEKHYPNSVKKQDSPTIKLTMKHITFELIPALENIYAYHTYDTYKIPTSPESGFWIDTNPKDFKQQLINHSRQHNGKTKPLIRLMKYWNARNGYVFKSYELERMIVTNNIYGIMPTYNHFGLNYGMQRPSLQDYFFQSIKNLPLYGGTPDRNTKVQRAKNIVMEIECYNNNITYAHTGIHHTNLIKKEIYRLLPPPSGFTV